MVMVYTSAFQIFQMSDKIGHKYHSNIQVFQGHQLQKEGESTCKKTKVFFFLRLSFCRVILLMEPPGVLERTNCCKINLRPGHARQVTETLSKQIQLYSDVVWSK